MGTIKKVFILHGWTYSTDAWEPFTDSLKNKGMSATMLSIPGLSEKTNKTWTLDDYVEWLKDKLKGEKDIALLGHSNGGRIGIAFASKYPEKVSHLILIDSAGIYHNDLLTVNKRLLFKIASKIGKLITTSEKLKNLLYKFAGETDYKDATLEMKQTLVNLISVDLTPKLKEIKTPTLIIWGRHDKATPLKDGQLMHQLIEGSELLVIETAKHSPQFTHIEEVSEKIIDFLTE